MNETLPPYFYCPGERVSGEVQVLDPDESRHVSAARRLQCGDRVFVTNGEGQRADCVIDAVEARGRRVSIRVESIREEEGPKPERILASAIAKAVSAIKRSA